MRIYVCVYTDDWCLPAVIYVVSYLWYIWIIISKKQVATYHNLTNNQ